ncbi:hypothetical protein K501DRAFT_243894 [Backusella circina FSU 941]|nr:hypothetical protein K501DRAFT_243894 [Backusella circina FSU 941]
MITTPPSLLQHQHSTLSDYANILDANNNWSIRQANSRLDAYKLESALEQDLSRQCIPLSDLSHYNPYHGMSSMAKPPQQQKPVQKAYGFEDPFEVAPLDAWQEIKDYNLKVNGLPTLDQMMRLTTYSPLTQSNFSHFLKERNVQQSLNFLMELETHDKLWKAFLSSQDRHHRQRVSRFLESAAEKTNNSSGILPSFEMGRVYVETPDTDDLLTPSTQRSTSPSTFYASRTDRSLNRHDLVQNAIRIYRTYCMAHDAAQPIHLPDEHRRALETLIEHHHRPEPVIFDSARSHTFEILNVFYYPLFIDECLCTNISRPSARLLFIMGFLFLTLALSIEFSLIFLDVYRARWLAMVPFFLGWSFFVSSLSRFAWWLGLFRISELGFMIYSDIQDVTVKRLQFKKAWLWLAFVILISLISTITFVFIPSHRL